MLRKKARFLSLLLCAVLSTGLIGCSKDAEIPDVAFLGDAVVISREDGSGTKAEFESMIDTAGSGIDQIAASTDEVLSLVADTENAIGYLAYSSATAGADVSVLAVNGITASEETIQNGKYPLCRNYYVAYSGELSDAENDFMTYILSSGQNIVSNYAIPVKASASFLSDKSAGTIQIAGSSSVAPILEALAEDYETINPNVTIGITVTDSTAGLTAAMRGECDLAISSRDLKSYEEELLTKKAIAKDAIAVIVNTKNPVTNLSTKQIKKLYDGQCGTWADLK